MTNKTLHQESKILFIVHDETVLQCDFDHRVISYMTLDKSKAEEYLKKHYTLKISEITLDTEPMILKNYLTIEGLDN